MKDIEDRPVIRIIFYLCLLCVCLSLIKLLNLSQLFVFTTPKATSTGHFEPSPSLHGEKRDNWRACQDQIGGNKVYEVRTLEPSQALEIYPSSYGDQVTLERAVDARSRDGAGRS